MDLIEVNEAFAVQSLAVMRELGLRPEITNVTAARLRWGIRWAVPGRAS
jgi:acetyl-CoA acetyltransferase